MPGTTSRRGQRGGQLDHSRALISPECGSTGFTPLVWALRGARFFPSTGAIFLGGAPRQGAFSPRSTVCGVSSEGISCRPGGNRRTGLGPGAQGRGKEPKMRLGWLILRWRRRRRWTRAVRRCFWTVRSAMKGSGLMWLRKGCHWLVSQGEWGVSPWPNTGPPQPWRQLEQLLGGTEQKVESLAAVLRLTFCLRPMHRTRRKSWQLRKR